MSGRLAYLLDTNMLSDLVRNPRGAVANRIAAAGEDSVCTSITVEPSPSLSPNRV